MNSLIEGYIFLNSKNAAEEAETNFHWKSDTINDILTQLQTQPFFM